MLKNKDAFFQYNQFYNVIFGFVLPADFFQKQAAIGFEIPVQKSYQENSQHITPCPQIRNHFALPRRHGRNNTRNSHD